MLGNNSPHLSTDRLNIVGTEGFDASVRIVANSASITFAPRLPGLHAMA